MNRLTAPIRTSHLSQRRATTTKVKTRMRRLIHRQRMVQRRPIHSTPNASELRVAESIGLKPVRDFIAKLIAFLAIITCTFGNLAAYAQTNIKRLLAYSTIAHAGYMMMAVPPVMALISAGDPAGGRGRSRRSRDLHHRLPVHESRCLRRRRVPTKCNAKRRDRGPTQGC